MLRSWDAAFPLNNFDWNLSVLWVSRSLEPLFCGHVPNVGDLPLWSFFGVHWASKAAIGRPQVHIMDAVWLY